MDPTDPSLWVDDHCIGLRWSNGVELACRWDDLEEVAVRIAAPGEGLDGWLILRDDNELTIPIWLSGDEEVLRAAFARLRGFDWSAVERAILGPTNADAIVWRRAASG